MQVFAIFKHGIYRHECAGIFTSYTAAKKIARDLARDGDQYHHYRVVPFELNEPVPCVLTGSSKENLTRYGDAVVDEPEPLFSTKEDHNATVYRRAP